MPKPDVKGSEPIGADSMDSRENDTVPSPGPENPCAELGAARLELETLYAALDNVRSGLLILDGELHARYANPALHDMFKVHDREEIRNGRPFYGDMLRAAASASAVDLDDYVVRRLAWVSSGDAPATDLNMTNGAVLRCQLAKLPNGGRMLIYSDVTDIVRAAQEMEQLATIDGMTGIFNRRHFLAMADREWVRARRYGRPLSFLMVDIDYFKSINDRFGHHIGDSAIVHVAQLAAGCKRSSDLLARVGGEEFALLLPDTGVAEAEAIAERLRGEVAISPLAEVSYSTTVSIGVATADETMAGVSDLMRLADQALYTAKRTGRNRVTSGIAVTESPALTGEDADDMLKRHHSSKEPVFDAGSES